MSVLRWHSVRLRLTLLGVGLVAATGAVLLVATLILARPGLVAGLVLIALWTLLCGAALGVAHVVTGRALRPLREVTAVARRLSTESLDQRIGYRGPDDEIAELAATFDAMLDRLGQSVAGQKRFVANASHELRTPLAVIRTEIDVTMADPDADVTEYRRMAGVVRDASTRANHLVDALLLLARTESRGLARRKPVDLSDAVSTALSAVRLEATRMAVQLRTELAPAPVTGEPGLLERLAGNLIENAVRYNHLGGQVWIRTGADATSAWLTVANTGVEVAPEDVPGLFEPFRRGGMDRTGSRGAGLGMSIVRAVCLAHGGGVTATARPGGGLEITARLPVAAGGPVQPAPRVTAVAAYRPPQSRAR